MREGTPNFDGILVGEFSVSFIESPSVLSAKAAFVNKTTGHTHGWTSNAQWTPATLRKLQELREAMEEDLAEIHFREGRAAQGGGPGLGLTPKRPLSLGDHLDAESV
jgi:hypothetical protein